MSERTVEVEEQSEDESIVVNEEDEVVQHMKSVADRSVKWADDWEYDTAGKIVDMEVVEEPSDELMLDAGIATDVEAYAGPEGQDIHERLMDVDQRMGEAVGAGDEWRVRPAVITLTVELPGGDTFTDAFRYPRDGGHSEVFELFDVLETMPEMDESPIGETVPVKTGGGWNIVIPDEPAYVSDDQDGDEEVEETEKYTRSELVDFLRDVFTSSFAILLIAQVASFLGLSLPIFPAVIGAVILIGITHIRSLSD